MAPQFASVLYFFYKDKALFGWIPGSRASLFVDSPNFRKKSPCSSGEDVAVCSLSSYHGRTHWAEGHPLSPKSWVKVSCLSRGRGRMEIKKGGLNGWPVKDKFLCQLLKGFCDKWKEKREGVWVVREVLGDYFFFKIPQGHELIHCVCVRA